jgi:hypothetical protein
MALLTIADLNQPQNVLAPYIQRAQGLSQIYFDHIANTQDLNYKYAVEIFGSKERSQGIHASEISKCMRALVYGIAGVERKPEVRNTDVNMLMRFRIGQAVHAMVQYDWHLIANKPGSQMTFRDEVRVSPELGGVAELWNIHSSCDGEITLLDAAGNPEIRVGLEIKTMSDKQYDKLKSPQHDHVEQTNVYMATLDVPLMWVLYYNKSSSNVTTSFPPYLFQFDGKLWRDELEIRFARCIHMAQTGIVPEGTEGLYCKWCPFTYLCGPTILKPKSRTTRVAAGMRRNR